MKAFASVIGGFNAGTDNDGVYYVSISAAAVAFDNSGLVMLVDGNPAFSWGYTLDGTETPTSIRNALTGAIRTFYSQPTLQVVYLFDATGALGL
jgi:hypothetical protein